MSSQMMPAIKIINTIVPLRMTNPASGIYVFDLGQNISGWALIKVSGPGNKHQASFC